MKLGTEATKSKRLCWGDPGSKCTRRTDAIVFSRGTRSVIVTVYPDGLIGLRLTKGRREEFANAADLYRQAVVVRVRSEREAKKAKRGQTQAKQLFLPFPTINAAIMAKAPNESRAVEAGQ